MPYALSTEGRRAKRKKDIDFRVKISLDIIKDAIYKNFDKLELYIVASEEPDESLNDENELLLTVCDILERIEQKLFD